MNDPGENVKANQNQKVIQPPNTVPVGFWVDLQNYQRYKAIAHKMHNQIITDDNGNQRRMLEHDDVNELVYFATEYFISINDYTQQMMKSGNIMGFIKDMMKKLGPLG